MLRDFYLNLGSFEMEGQPAESHKTAIYLFLYDMEGDRHFELLIGDMPASNVN